MSIWISEIYQINAYQKKLLSQFVKRDDDNSININNVICSLFDDIDSERLKKTCKTIYTDIIRCYYKHHVALKKLHEYQYAACGLISFSNSYFKRMYQLNNKHIKDAIEHLESRDLVRKERKNIEHDKGISPNVTFIDLNLTALYEASQTCIDSYPQKGAL